MVLRWMQEETVELERSFFVLSPRNASSLPLLTQLQIWFWDGILLTEFIIKQRLAKVDNTENNLKSV